MEKIIKIIGVDPGVSTGFAVLDVTNRQFDTVATLDFERARKAVEILFITYGENLLVVVEDARLRSGKSPAYMQGVGAIKIQCKLWEGFLKSLGVNYVMQQPRNTKTKAPLFKQITGYQGRTSEHARDAAMIAFRFNIPIWESKKSLKP